jgi:two-component system KDP operon response regulator KdpE
VVLSARGQEAQKIAALDAGADDYLVKPFGFGELLARLRVALRHAVRSEGAEEGILRAGPLVVDLVRRRIEVDGREVHLTPTEYRILATLAKHADRVVTHRQLLQEVWGPRSTEHTHYLRVYMTHLRRKLEPDPVRPRLLITEPGVGYRLRGEA